MAFKKFQRNWKKVPLVACDAVVVGKGRVLLIKRGRKPFKGSWSLPGGFLELGETCEQCVEREVFEETGLIVNATSLVGVYSDVGRDPRGRIVSVCFLTKPVGGKLRKTREAVDEKWFSLNNLPHKMGADHKKMVLDAKKLLKKSQ